MTLEDVMTSGASGIRNVEHVGLRMRDQATACVMPPDGAAAPVACETGEPDPPQMPVPAGAMPPQGDDS